MFLKSKGKKVAALAVAVAAATIFAGCTSSGSQSSGSGSGDNNVTLHVLTWTSNPDQLKVLKSIAAKFVKSKPQVVAVKFQSVQAAQEGNVLTTDLSSGDAPDVAWLAVQNSRQFISSKVLMNLTPTLKKYKGYDYSDLIPKLQSDWSRGSSLYGVPMSTSGRAMYYNADLFKAAGLPLPTEMIKQGTWTWPNVEKAAAEITARTKKPGFVVETTDWSELVPLMYAYGASPWNAKANTCTMTSPGMVGAMSLLHKMIYQDKTTPLPGQGTSGNFWTGGAALDSNYLSRVSLLEKAKFNWGLVPTPTGPGGSKTQLGQTSWVAFKASKHPELAAELVAALTTKESGRALSPFFASTRKSLLTASVLHDANPAVSKQELEPLVEATKKDGAVAPVSNNGTATTDALNSALNAYLYKKDANVQKAMASVCAQLKPALAK